MDPDEKALHDHIIVQYRQDVDQLKYALARANAQTAAKDQLIAELRALLEGPAAAPAVPKPGPPPTN